MTVKRGRVKGPHGAGPHRAAGFSGSARKTKRYGWIPDLPDQRDFTYAVSAPVANIPSSVDLRDKCPPVYDQGQLGSCTANAIAGALEFEMMKQGLNAFIPSRLFIYYNERAMEGTIPTDAGAMIRDGIKSVANQGDCPEGNVGDPPPAWPYDIGKFAVQPAQACFDKAKDLKAVSYHSVTQNLADMKGCLAEGYPFVFGFTVYESFESADVAKTGNVPMPKAAEQVLGGHAVLAVGYDDDERVFICRNSWGDAWGDAGYFYMPYA
ncbi:MAG TPA: C1 family peptidase [Gemmataceae bacterium]|nr:C1 family peptidase [Gemmataceae bacterium]